MANVPSTQETIAAISTPPGAGGIGIIRISGDNSLPILKKIFLPKDTACSFTSHRLYYGHIQQPIEKIIVDEVLAVYMASPHTYTREDVVEIHCHGSFIVLQRVLEIIIELGARLASPGEFTKLAFLNGRIDLTQAEAVIDILSAKTRKGVDLAQEQLSGALYTVIDPIRKSLVLMRAVIEVAIDFPDEDHDILHYGDLIKRIENEVIEPISQLIIQAEQGRIYRDGVAIVIAGVPNVGKSSLLNTILREERALVTSIPGTTRDSIEEYIDIDGMPVRIIDTAGIRANPGEIEELGIRRAKELINQADLVLFMVDGSRALEEADIDLYRTVCHKPLLSIINKIDLCGDVEPDISSLVGENGTSIKISAKEQIGIDELKHKIFSTITTGNEQWEEGGCAPNIRHKNALIQAQEAANRVLDALRICLSSDLIAVDLQECLDQLGDIVGETTTEDILDVIFEQFCLGK